MPSKPFIFLTLLWLWVGQATPSFAGGDQLGAGAKPQDLLSAPAEAEAEVTARNADATGDRMAGDVVFHALALLGIDYRHGGRAPVTGLDCSGLVRYVYREAQGMELPYTSREMSRIGVTVARESLAPGDLVFYHTLRRAFSHVGIYLGGNRFIHAPSTGGEVRIDDMTATYWARRFDGARRISQTPAPQ